MAADIPPAQADPARSDLLGLARNFVDRVGKGFDRADNYLNKIKERAGTEIPDGEVLLLEIALNGVALTENVYAQKNAGDVDLSLRDFSMIARFPIVVDPETGRATGWYIKEENVFDLDLNAGTIKAGKEVYTLEEADARIEGDDILVRGQKLAFWLGFDLSVEYETQTARIFSKDPWPVELEMARRKRIVSGSRQQPSQPRLDAPYEWVAVPNVELNVNQALNRFGPDGDINKRTDYSLSAAGDLAAHTVRAVVTGNDETPVSSARVSFSRQSEDPVLLGPLKARSYEFGDIAVTPVPMAGTTRTGVGVRISSANPYYTSGTTTQITGDAPPGWDVELYRNNRYLGLVTVGADGRYAFDDVDLFGGENIFRVVQYGPLGEQREEQRRIISSANLAGMEGVYDVSLTAADTQIWEKDPRNTQERGDIHLSGIYEKQVDETATMRVGARSTTVKDERKNYLYAGGTKVIGGTLLGADAGLDMDGALSLSANARHRFGDHSVSLSGNYTSEDYGATSSTSAPSSYGFRGLVGGPLASGNNWYANYLAQTDVTFRDDGSHHIEHEVSANASVGRMGGSQSIVHINEDNGAGTTRQETLGSTALRGTALGMTWRATANYEIDPELAMHNYILDLTRPISNDLYTNFRLEHVPEQKYTQARAALSWNAGYALVTPTVTYDSDDNLGVMVSLRSGLAYDESSGKTVITGQPVLSTGGFSALVYLDRNGDRRYDSEIDEVLPDVTVRAIHSHRFGVTDKTGRAFIHDLPLGRATDVIVDEASLPDVFWMPAFEGVSVLPRSGYVAKTEFPIHVGGEIDGTISVMRDGLAVPLRGVNLALYHRDGRLQSHALSAPDGFYLFERVPPGRYLLMLEDSDAVRYGLSRPQPQEIVIGYDGTVISGNNIVVDGDGVDVPVGFAAEVNKYLAFNKGGIDMNDRGVILNLGSYRSQLLMGLNWYKIRQRYGVLLQGGQLMVAPSQSFAAPQNGLHQLLVAMPHMNLDAAVQRCRAFMARSITCRVELQPEEVKPGYIAGIAAREN